LPDLEISSDGGHKRQIFIGGHSLVEQVRADFKLIAQALKMNARIQDQLHVFVLHNDPALINFLIAFTKNSMLDKFTTWLGILSMGASEY
jgi:hypothetical protein